MKGKSGMAGAGGGEIEKSLRYYGRLRAGNAREAAGSGHAVSEHAVSEHAASGHAATV